MGLTHITLQVANPARPQRTLPVEFLVDSTLLGTVTLEALGVILGPSSASFAPLPMILA